MSLLARLESRFGRWAIPNITVILIAGQVLLYFLQMSGAGRGEELVKIHLLPSAVLSGEIWRLVTFLFVPPATSSIFVIFYWILMFLFGSALEQHWGTFRFNIYLLIGYLANIAAAFIAYALGFDQPASNGFLYGTLFLAFALVWPVVSLGVNFFFKEHHQLATF